MKVIVDTREQVPWTFEGLGVECVRQTLSTGDYSLPGLESRVCIERKSLDDWIGTVMSNRTRFYNELRRMSGFDFRCVIIEAGVREIMAGNYTSSMKPASVMGFCAEVSVSQHVPVYLAGSRAEAQVLAASFLRMCEKKIQRAPSAG